jgi:hypothetical protein
MKARLLFLASLLLFSFVPTLAQDPCADGTPFRNCRACGRAKKTPDNPSGHISDRAKRLNVQKNRSDKATHPEELTVADIRSASSENACSPLKQVWVKGYVASLVPGGYRESCNCGKVALRDIHINIVADPSEKNNQSKYVIVEITPRWQEQFGLDDSDYDAMFQKVSQELRHKWVRFEGWMIYDYIHANQSKSTQPQLPTCPNDGEQHSDCNWRGTPWEVHPVTKYTVVSGP